MNNILTIGNWIFLPIQNFGECTIPHETKYVSCSRSGRITLDHIYTYDEILKRFPDVEMHEYIVCTQSYKDHE